jgi:prolyl 4-hydroxylase
MTRIEVVEIDDDIDINETIQEPNINTLNELPSVFTINKFITDEECQHMITISKPIMKDSLVSDNKTGTISKGRTSKNAWIQHNHDKITKQIGEKIAKVVDIPLENAEAFQVIYYGEGGEYRRHYDSWTHDGSEKTLRCMKYGGARIKTALVYLNDVEEGGSTCLNKINVDVNAEKGKLLVFENTYTNSNIKHPLSEHAGMPVIKGEKYAFNLWFKECHSKKLYSEFNPDYYKTNHGLDRDSDVSNNEHEKTTDVSGVHVDIMNDSIPKYKYNTVLKLPPNMSKEIVEKNIYTSSKFIFSSECEKIINNCKFNTSSSQKYANCWLKKTEFPELIEKLEEYTNISADYFENMNIFKYLPGQHHGPFTDAYNLDSEVGKKNTSKLGQRIFTLSISLNNTVEYCFPKIKKNISFPPRTLLLYDNIKDDTIRDIDMNTEHTVKNSNDTESYVLNIYIREKDTKGNNMMSLPDHVFQKTYTAVNMATEAIKEDFQKTYEEVLNMFETKMITQSWPGHKSFKYLFKGDFSFFQNYVSKYIDSMKIVETITYNIGEDSNMVDISNRNDYKTALNLDLLKTKPIFDEYHPIVLENTIKPETLYVLQEYYRTTIEKGVFLLGDKQSKRFKAHNEPMSRLLHYEMLPLIEHIVGKPLQPTYTYLSCYVKDSDLPAHTDRADCEYTVSYVINKPADITWPIYFHTKKQPIKHQGRVNFTPPKDECIECDCGPGGLMMFNGTDHVHFREKLDSEYYHIVLLHYRSV